MKNAQRLRLLLLLVLVLVLHPGEGNMYGDLLKAICKGKIVVGPYGQDSILVLGPYGQGGIFLSGAYGQDWILCLGSMRTGFCFFGLDPCENAKMFGIIFTKGAGGGGRED